MARNLTRRFVRTITAPRPAGPVVVPLSPVLRVGKRRGLYVWTAADGAAGLVSTRASDATYTSQAGIVTPAGVGVARDADYSTGQRGLLVESQRTNAAFNSDPTLAQATTKSADVQAAIGMAAFGFAHGLALADGVPAGTSFAYVDTTAIAAGLTCALSLFVVMNDNGVPVVTNSSSSGDLNMRFSTGVPAPAPVVTHPGLLYRVSVVATRPAAGSDTCGWSKPTVTPRGFRVTGYQLEVGNFSSSYIPTAGASATRAADAVRAVGVLPVGIHATRYEKFYDLATAAVVERVVDVPATGADAVFADATITDRVWYAMAWDEGVKTLAEMQELVQ